MNDKSGKTLLLIFILIALGVFLRSYHLGDKILWTDEGYDLNVAKMKSVHQIIEYEHNAVLPPLPNIIDHFWVGLFGESVAAIHAESLLWSVLGLLLFAATAYQFLSRPAALAAIAFFSLNPFLPEFAQTMRYFSLALLIAQLWFYALLRYRRDGGLIWILMYALAHAVALNLHFYSLYTIACLSVFFIVGRRKWKLRLWPLLAAHAVAILIILPRFMLMSRTGVMELGNNMSFNDALAYLARIPAGAILKIFYSFCVGGFVPFIELSKYAEAFLVLPYLLLIGIALLDKENRFLILLCFSTLFGSLFVGWMGMIFKGVLFLPKYYVFLNGMYCLLLGAGAAGLWKKNRALACCFLAFYFAVTFSGLFTYWTRLNRPENQKTLFEYTQKQMKPGDFLNISPPYRFAFNYYFKGGMPVHDFSFDFDPDTRPHSDVFLLTSNKRQITDARMVRWHSQLASKYKRVWMFWMFGYANTEDSQQVARRWMDSHYERMETIPYRIFPYRDEYSGIMVLYRIKPLRTAAVP